MQQVVSILKTYAPEIDQITGQTQIARDLKLWGDDPSFAAMEAQEATKSRPPLKAWEKVYTVDDMVDLLLKYSGEAVLIQQAHSSGAPHAHSWHPCLVRIRLSCSRRRKRADEFRGEMHQILNAR